MPKYSRENLTELQSRADRIIVAVDIAAATFYELYCQQDGAITLYLGTEDTWASWTSGDCTGHRGMKRTVQ